MKKLPPQHLKPKYYEPVEAQIQAIFYDLLFRPLKIIIEDTTTQMSPAAHGLLNATENPLQVALRSGRIQYEAGTFSGQFSAAIVGILRAIGGVYNRSQKVYTLDPERVPGWVKAEAAAYQSTARGAHEAMKRRLDEIQRDLDTIIDKAKLSAGKTVRDVSKDFGAVAEAISIKPELSADSHARLAADYTKNLKIYINDFSKKMIGDLRQDVEKNAEQGYRFDKLIDSVKRRYAVTQNKAKFLARQETGLFMAKYRRERFSEAGVTHYRWSTSHDSRVRPEAGTKGIARKDNHRVLDGRTFAYSDPPVVDTATGRKANPGEDYNCRCVDIPILERIEVPA